MYNLYEALKLETVIYDISSNPGMILDFSQCGNTRVDRHYGIEKGEVSFLKPQIGKMKRGSR